jgi:aspartyl aminopeptidase
MMAAAEEMAGFIDASPTQFHAVHNAAQRLIDAGFQLFDPSEATHAETPQEPGARFVVRDGALIAWVDGEAPLGPMRMIGAHTDSPNLRIRPRPDTGTAGFQQLGIEVYGGALLNSWLDRDLGIAGRVALRWDGPTQSKLDVQAVEHRLFRSEGPQVRVPQLAIHLDRDIHERGLVLNKQTQMTPIWALGNPHEGEFRSWLGKELDFDPRQILSWDLACFDVQSPSTFGREAEFLASARLDNLCSSFGAVEALIAAKWAGHGPAVIVLFDHEEIGSTSATGADSTWLSQVLEQRAAALGGSRSAFLASLPSSLMLSADMAHATHPNYAERHEPNHWVHLGGGPVIKHNVNGRYATDSATAAAFREVCRSVQVPVQEYSHRGDLPCGSTIGPLAAAQLAVPTVDVGMAQLSMHSIREVMAVKDVDLMITAFTAWFNPSNG